MPIPAGPPAPDDLPEWAPSAFDVADFVPHRTLTHAEFSTTESQDSYQWGFSETTRPTLDSVTRLIARAVAAVTSRLVPLNAASTGAAGTIVCLWAAAWVERGWPEDDNALQRANDLEKRADLLLAALVVSNDLANGGDDGDPETPDGAAVAPAYSFPAPDLRFDSPLYF